MTPRELIKQLESLELNEFWHIPITFSEAVTANDLEELSKLIARKMPSAIDVSGLEALMPLNYIELSGFHHACAWLFSLHVPVISFTFPSCHKQDLEFINKITSHMRAIYKASSKPPILMCQFEEADADLQKAFESDYMRISLKLDAKEIYTHEQLIALYHHKVGNRFAAASLNDLALRAYNIAIEAYPRFPQAYLAIARVRANTKEFSEAKDNYQEFIDLETAGSNPNLQLLCDAYMELDKIVKKDNLALLEKALDCETRSSPSRKSVLEDLNVRIGDCYMHLNEYEKARDIYAKVPDNSKFKYWATWQSAMCLWQLKNSKKTEIAKAGLFGSSDAKSTSISADIATSVAEAALQEQPKF